MTPDEINLRLRRSRQLATLLDSAWVIPGTGWRIGLDALIGLLPVGGDLISAILGLGIVWQAQKLNAPRSLILHMLANIGLDFLLGAIPIVGDVADIAYRKNLRNANWLEKWAASQTPAKSGVH